MSEPVQVITYQIDIEPLVDIGNTQLERIQGLETLLEDTNAYLASTIQMQEVQNNILLSALVILGAVLGAVIFRHLRK